jgi:hypothetical protein
LDFDCGTKLSKLEEMLHQGPSHMYVTHFNADSQQDSMMYGQAPSHLSLGTYASDGTDLCKLEETLPQTSSPMYVTDYKAAY